MGENLSLVAFGEVGTCLRWEINSIYLNVQSLNFCVDFTVKMIQLWILKA